MNPEYLLELTGGDRAVVREILGDFLASDAGDRAQLAAAVASGDRDEIQQAAHRIKGAARSIGAADYAAAAAAVEEAAPAGVDITASVAGLEAAARALAEWGAAFE